MYFELLYDQSDVNMWHLHIDPELPDGTWWDVWAFTRCERISDPTPVTAMVDKVGHEVDFNFASFNIPIVSRRLGNLIASAAGHNVQRMPVSIAGRQLEWEALNVLNCVDCLDHKRSIIDYYPQALSDPIVTKSPGRAGKPRGVRKLAIDGRRVGEFHVFRIKHWEVPIIVSQDVRDKMLHEGISGIRFSRVSDTSDEDE